MSQFVKKTVMGYKDVSGGASDPECTHVILTRKEYDRQLQKTSVAEQAVRDMKHNAEREIQQVQSDARRKVSEVEAEAGKKIEMMEQQVSAAQEEAEYQKRLNANLLRISRERANADRNLRPKKEHTGYQVVFMEEKDYRYKEGRSWRKIRLWETVLQSPYSVEFAEEQARKQIEVDLFTEDWSITKIGITGRYDGTYEDMIADSTLNQEFLAGNVELAKQQRLRANFRSKYWEFIFMHTRPLNIVPPEMRVS